MRLKKHHWGILLLTILILGGLAGYSLVRNGLFPVAVVNGKIITLKTVEENAAVAQRLWEQGVSSEGDRGLEDIFSSGQGKLFEETFESLILNRIIETGAPENIRARASVRLKESIAGADLAALRSTVETAYGWSLDRFEERILKPQAIEEVLREELGDGYSDWVLEQRAGASVRILFVPFRWHEGQLCRAEEPSVC